MKSDIASAKPFRTEDELAAYLDQKPSTLRRWRQRRIGPPFSRPKGLKKPIYPNDGTEKWIAGGMVYVRKGAA